MNASELNRKLLFSGYAEATDFLNSSPLNRYLYKFFIDKLPQYRIDVPIVTFFNEIYYQCVRINYDGTPGVYIEQRYLAEEEEWIKSDVATQLVFCIVWTLFKNKRNITFHEECLFRQLTPLVKNGEFYDLTRRITGDFRSHGIEVPDEFPTKSCHISAIPRLVVNVFDNVVFSGNDFWFKIVEPQKYEQKLRKYCEAWCAVTSNFSHFAVEKYMQLYPKNEDRLALIHTIGLCHWKIFVNAVEFHCLDKYFQDLEASVKAGSYNDTHSNLYANPYFSSDGDDDGQHEPAATDKESERTELLQEKCKELNHELVEQQHQHELEISKMEAQYETEIVALKKKLALLSGEEKVAEACSTTGESDSKDIALSVSEMVAHVKECFDEAAAYQFCHLFYSLASKHGHLNKEASALIDSIIPAIKVREARHQTINIPTVQQLNLNPKEVVNHTKEE